MVRCFTHHHNLVQFLRVGSMVCLEDFNFKSTRRNLIKDSLRIECTVVVAHPRMVTTDDKVGCAHVLTEYRVQYRFAWTGIQHIEPVPGNHCTVWGEVQL